MVGRFEPKSDVIINFIGKRTQAVAIALTRGSSVGPTVCVQSADLNGASGIGPPRPRAHAAQLAMQSSHVGLSMADLPNDTRPVRRSREADAVVAEMTNRLLYKHATGWDCAHFGRRSRARHMALVSAALVGRLPMVPPVVEWIRHASGGLGSRAHNEQDV